MRRFFLALAFTVSPALVFAQSQVPSIRDIVQLSKAGLDDEVILTLIEVNHPVYPVDADTLKGLKSAGVSSKVITAMIRSGRENVAEPAASMPIAQEQVAPPTAPIPPIVVVEREAPEPRVREVAVPVPVYIAAPSRRHRGEIDGSSVPDRHAPVYWGWGGKRRPDSWRTISDVQKDARIPLQPQRK